MPNNESDLSTEFDDLKTKVFGVLQMLKDEFPAAAERAREIIEGAPAQAELDAEARNAEAIANAIKQLKSEAGKMLAPAEETPAAP